MILLKVALFNFKIPLRLYKLFILSFYVCLCLQTSTFHFLVKCFPLLFVAFTRVLYLLLESFDLFGHCYLLLLNLLLFEELLAIFSAAHDFYLAK